MRSYSKRLFGLVSALALPFCPAIGSSDVDLDILEINFKAKISQRLDSFPKPDYVKTLKKMWVSNVLDFKIKLVSESYARQVKAADEIFVRGNTIMLVMLPPERCSMTDHCLKSFVVAFVDPAHPGHKEAVRGMDMILLAGELALNETDKLKRRKIFKELESATTLRESQGEFMNRPAVAEKVWEVFLNRFSYVDFIKFGADLVYRYQKSHPGYFFPDDLKNIFGFSISFNIL